MRGDIRATGRIISSGQPRSYADSQLTAYVIFERQGWGSDEFTSYAVTEEVARAAAAGLMIGYTPVKKSEAPMFGSYLLYFKAASKVEDDRASIWEFRVITPFTD